MKRYTGILLCLLAFGLYANGGWDNVGGRSHKSYIGIEEIVIDNAKIFSIEVDGNGGFMTDLDVISDSQSPYEVSAQQFGKQLVVRVEKKIITLFSSTDYHTIKLTVPRQCSLRLKSATGAISVRNVEGDLTLESSTGHIDIEKAKGEIDVDTSTGNITIADCFGDIRVESSTGNIHLSDVEGSLRGESSTGSINASHLMITDDSRFETSTGKIQMDIDNFFSECTFKISSSTGRIQVGAIEARKELRTGEGPILIDIHSSTGSVEIY